jgi:hypothetical protein
MSWEEFALARKVLLEEHIGTRVRQAKRDEDAVAKQTRKRAQRGR